MPGQDVIHSQTSPYSTLSQESIRERSPGNNHEESGDPHDLAYSYGHAPRASMVESMAMALDQFSHGPFRTATVASEGEDYEDSSEPRRRAHTHSASIASESDLPSLQPVPQIQTVRVTRRDSTKYRKDLQKLPSIFGEDEDSVRAKVYDSQRADFAPKPKPRKKPRSGTNASAGSASSSVDLGHLAAYKGRLGPAGNRRSRSFDFGSSHRVKGSFDAPAPIDVAPHPIIFAGPDAQSSPTKTSFQGQMPPIVRRNSNKSSRTAPPWKPRAGTLGTGTVKSNPTDLAPPMPTSHHAGNNSRGTPENRSTTTSPHEPNFPSRPGFFRRMWGSSKNTPNLLLDQSHVQDANPRPSHDRPLAPVVDSTYTNAPPSRFKPVRTSTDLSANKENHPVVTKKPSSFFRRRKKSVSNTAPPPLPLTLGPASAGAIQPGEPSPVSSLRAFMDPYLANEGAATVRHVRNDSGNSLRTYNVRQNNSPKHKPVRPQLNTSGRSMSDHLAYERQQAKKTSGLRIPHQDSFLVDSSSTEEPSQRSTRDISPISNSGQQEKTTRPKEASLKPSSPRPFAASSSSLARNTVISDRHPSYDSERVQRTASAQSQVSQDDGASSVQLGKNDSRASSKMEIAAKSSVSDISEYRSAPSTPLVTEMPKAALKSPVVHVSHPSLSQTQDNHDREKARKIYDNADDELNQTVAAAWLGEAGQDREKVRNAFMGLFDFTHLNILASLRSVCDRIVLRGETQQMDRLIEAFAHRWCYCNNNHGFKSFDVVHTICYSILLLNTDLHLAEIGQKMTRNQFVKNALPTIKTVAQDSEPGRSSSAMSATARSPTPGREEQSRQSTEQDLSTHAKVTRRPVEKLNREDSENDVAAGNGGLLIDAPFTGTDRGWENQIETVLRNFYTSISQEPLPLFGAPAESAAPTHPNNNLLSLGTNMLRRTPSTLSKAQSDAPRNRLGPDSRSLGARFISKARSRPRLPSAAGFGSSRTSLDDQSSAWSPSMSSTWSKNSFGKGLTSMSTDSFGTEITHSDYQSSIGFANALSQAIVRPDQFDIQSDEGLKATSILEDESLELSGAPWAKEGILKHKCHLEGVDKRSKDRNWNDCFAVIEKGWMRLFSFSMTAKSLRTKARNQRNTGVVGGGNWQDNAEEVWKFMLRHAIASALPPPGYSKTRPYVWALSLPTGAVHLFSVGTPDIVKEFVTTANFWSARLSKEPMMGGVSNMEYGWSDSVINRALINTDSRAISVASPRPSTQLSMRSSLDQGGSARPRLPGDRAHINDWNPPQQSMFASQLMEVDQLKALQTYVQNVEEELQKHNELRGPMQIAFSSKHPNSAKAMGNWEKKSSYLLREIVRFRTYIDALQAAQLTKDKIYKMRKEETDARQQEEYARQQEEDANDRANFSAATMGVSPMIG